MFYGFDTSLDANARARANVLEADVQNVIICNPDQGERLPEDGSFAFICGRDFLHDMTNPAPVVKVSETYQRKEKKVKERERKERKGINVINEDEEKEDEEKDKKRK